MRKSYNLPIQHWNKYKLLHPVLDTRYSWLFTLQCWQRAHNNIKHWKHAAERET